jgi:RimJ/RimL family protein N-acetyltransferase
VITFERCSDLELIRSILTHPRVYPKISDDFSPPASDYRPVSAGLVWYVLAKDVYDEITDTLGLWLLHQQNGVCWEVHTALLPCAWGEPGLEAARMLPDWIWSHTPCRRIITNVPSTNRLALHFAVKAGMKVMGINPASWLKDGMLCDQIMLGISPQLEEKRLTDRECMHFSADAILGNASMGPRSINRTVNVTHSKEEA